MSDPSTTAEVLVQALPYIKRFRGKAVVVKVGGRAVADPSLLVKLAEDIVLMHSVGLKPVVVHGGGPQITDLLGRLGIETEFRAGLRVTDADSLEIARMVLVGKVNRELVASINRHGPIAIGISGEDAGLLSASARHPELGYVGDVAAVNPSIVLRLLAEDLVPVISTIGSDGSGQAYNINADSVAAALAIALPAHKVLFLTDVEGLMAQPGNPESMISKTDVAGLQELMAGGAVTAGMQPKVTACIEAVKNGVPTAHMINGTVPHVLLVELFTDGGIGTMVEEEG